MCVHRTRAVAALTVLTCAGVVPTAVSSSASAVTPGQVVITEWEYNGSEFVELTNIGGQPVDMANYSYDDDSRIPGAVSLAGLGALAPGESGLLTEATADAFRVQWNLAPTVSIVGSNAVNLGRADEINVFVGAELADRLTYGDERFPGSIRTADTSGVPTSCRALGANDVGSWASSAAGDGLGSYRSTTGAFIASPGTSPLNTCGPVAIVGGDGGAGSSEPPLPCVPEAPGGTGPLAAGARPWPGAATVSVSDQLCAWETTTGPEGRDVSSLRFDPSNPNVLWAVKNKGWVFRLVNENGVWVPDSADGWAAGKQLFFPGGVGQPDAEGLTVGVDGALYVTTERDNAQNTIALNSVLRFDPAAPGTTLLPTHQWVLTADFPDLIVPGGNKDKANLGFEGITFVPDTYLVQNGFVDQSTGSAYDPAGYPGHGAGLFFAALENDGKLYAYALTTDGGHHRVAVVDTGMGHVMDVQFDAGLQRIWSLCDNTCSVSHTLLEVDATGTIVPDVVYAAPVGLPVVNIEGFAIAPTSTCVQGFRETVWSDDGIAAPGNEGHALYSGTFPCDLDLGEQGVPASIHLSTSSVAKKGAVVVTGAGFEPAEPVRIDLPMHPSTVSASVVIDDLGRFEAALIVPAGTQPGDYEVRATAVATTLVADLAVTAPAARR